MKQGVILTINPKTGIQVSTANRCNEQMILIGFDKNIALQKFNLNKILLTAAILHCIRMWNLAYPKHITIDQPDMAGWYLIIFL